MMKQIILVLFATLVVAGCASSRTVPLETVDAGAYLRDAAIIERKLEQQNRSQFDCIVQEDTLIVCDGVHHRLR
jgi:PBP1b-binding outer membrane lipoprotein LpoB